MQILMGVHSTNIIIDESKVYTKNLTNFIESNFSSTLVYKNFTTIKYHPDEHYSRVFLVKWLYSLYVNITNNFFIDMKEVLLKRIKKPIRIEFKNRVPKKIVVTIEIVEEEQIHICVMNPVDLEIVDELRAILLDTDKVTQKSNHNFIDISLDTNDMKEKIRDILKLTKLKKQDIIFSYDSQRLTQMLKHKEEKVKVYKEEISPYMQALLILEADKKEDIKHIEKRYKKLLKRYHPDNVYSQGDNEVLIYTEKFKSIQNAFNIVKDVKAA